MLHHSIEGLFVDHNNVCSMRRLTGPNDSLLEQVINSLPCNLFMLMWERTWLTIKVTCAWFQGQFSLKVATTSYIGL